MTAASEGIYSYSEFVYYSSINYDEDTDMEDYYEYIDYAVSLNPAIYTYDEYVSYYGDYLTYLSASTTNILIYNDWLLYYNNDFGYVTVTDTDEIPACLDYEELCSFDYLGSTFTVYVNDNGQECICEDFDATGDDVAYETVTEVMARR